MQDLWSQTFYGNTVTEWAIALGIAVGAFLVGKTCYWLLRGVARRMTERSSSKIDDIVLEMIDEPLVVIVTVFGLRIAAGTLSLPAGMRAFVGNALQAAVVLSVAWMIVRLFEAVLRYLVEPAVQRSDSDLDDQLLPVLRRGGKAAIWILGVIMALNNAGYDVAALLAGLGIGGLALAMAAQDTVKNVFGGFTIFSDRPFVINDRIVVDGFDGKVEEIGLRTTRIRTLAGRQVTIPNSSISQSSVENVSSEPSRKVIMTLGLTYDTTPDGMRRAMELLREIHAEHAEHVTEDIVVGFSGYGDFAMNVQFVYYIRGGADIVGTQTAINLAILERFNAANLAFAFPTQTIELATPGSDA